MIIGISGHKQSGKNTVASMLQYIYLIGVIFVILLMRCGTIGILLLKRGIFQM